MTEKTNWAVEARLVLDGKYMPEETDYADIRYFIISDDKTAELAPVCFTLEGAMELARNVSTEEPFFDRIPIVPYMDPYPRTPGADYKPGGRIRRTAKEVRRERGLR